MAVDNAKFFLVLGLLLLCFLPVAASATKGEDTLQAKEEFQALDDGFSDLGADEFTEITEEKEGSPRGSQRGLKIGLGALLFTVVAGVLVRFRSLRRLRAVFLLASLVVLGFWNGGCPCPISSFQNFWLWLIGKDVKTHSLIWFLALVPITYLLGRIWCGWVCHLGAFQEFLYRNHSLDALRGERVQKVLKGMQYSLFAILMIQLLVTRENLFVHYDPFKVAFNMASFHTLGWVLLGLLLLSSLLIYRPFCRGACPVGLVLGWVARIPGALHLQAEESCTSCHLCNRKCLSQAIGNDITFKTQDCIMCGECLDGCKRESVRFTR